MLSTEEQTIERRREREKEREGEAWYLIFQNIVRCKGKPVLRDEGIKRTTPSDVFKEQPPVILCFPVIHCTESIG